MEEFASRTFSSMEEVLRLTADTVTGIADKTIADLHVIERALEPHVDPLISSFGCTLLEFAVKKALIGAEKGSRHFFNHLYPGIPEDKIFTDYGVILHYTKDDNEAMLEAHIQKCFTVWKLLYPTCADIAKQLHPQIKHSRNTPAVTYGQHATSNITIDNLNVTAEYTLWVAAFGIFRTDQHSYIDNPTYAVIYSLNVAEGVLQGVIQ
jgi:hypothetical protein